MAYDFDYRTLLDILEAAKLPNISARLYVRGCARMKKYIAEDIRRLVQKGKPQVGLGKLTPPRPANSFIVRNMIVSKDKWSPQGDKEREFWKSLQLWVKLKHKKIWPHYVYAPQTKSKGGQASVTLILRRVCRCTDFHSISRPGQRIPLAIPNDVLTFPHRQNRRFYYLVELARRQRIYVPRSGWLQPN